MPDPTPEQVAAQPHGRSRFPRTFSCGCLIGMLTGAALTAIAAWGAWYVYWQAVADPLAGLVVDKERLTIDERRFPQALID